MSRIIVRNLPEKVTKEKLQQIFSEKGTVTDVQLKFTKSGKFRKFAFIGFKEEKSAQDAIESLNKTFINTSQIQIEVCAALGDPSKPKAWSKHAPDSSINQKRVIEAANDKKEEVVEKRKKVKTKIKDPKVEELVKNYQDDTLFKEYIESHLPQDEYLLKLSEAPRKETESSSNDEKKAADQEISDLDYIKLKTKKNEEDDLVVERRKELKEEKVKSKCAKNLELFTVKLSGLPYRVKKSAVKQFLHPVKPFTIRLPVKLKGIAFCGFKTETEMKRALFKNRSFLDGKRIQMVVQSQQVSDDKKEGKWKVQEDRLKNEESVAESGRIFLRNLPFTAMEDEVKQLFEKYGPITDVVMPIDSFTRKPKGFAIITYMIPENASKAFNELDGSIFQGRMLHLLPGLPTNSSEELDESNTNFKKKKAQKEKQSASRSTNWNTFFIGENALAESLAAKYNTSKENVLSDSNNGVAVRLALGETQMVSKMKEFLEENEVHLDSFENMTNCPRSNTIILIKNLPFGTTYDEVKDKFAGFGELKKIVLPPNGVAALVEYIEPSEAKKAFRQTAYSKFKHVPLYLEWAPKDTFKKESQNEGSKKETQIQETQKVEPLLEEEQEYEPTEPVEGATIFVKNLNFNTRTDSLKEHFKKCGKIISVTIAEKKDPKQVGKKLSMGYGFVQFSTKESADNALKTLQFSRLDDHTIELKRSNRTTSVPQTTKKSTDRKNKPSSKILVRNVPFQATQKEVEQLFKVFGEIKAVRLPKKMVGSGSHRGFCFVEFHTKADAKRAFEALSQSTHLYGRRLVLEWAATDDTDVDAIREKTAQHFHSEKPSKKNITIDEKEKTKGLDDNENEDEEEEEIDYFS